MFMLFFSILYGIMLNALIGYGAFPIANAFAREDIIGQDDWSGKYVYSKTRTSRWRFLLSLLLLNFAPLFYFALVFQSLSSTKTAPTVLQTFSLALLSLSVFAFFQFFLACATCRGFRKHTYTPFHFRRVINDKGFHPNPWYHLFAGIAYLGLGLVFLGVYFLNL